MDSRTFSFRNSDIRDLPHRVSLSRWTFDAGKGGPMAGPEWNVGRQPASLTFG